jgi:hypothetical protein
MGQLYDTKLRIETIIKSKNLDATKTLGLIGPKSGMVVAFISPTSPDDPQKTAKLKMAAKDVLGVDV